MKSNFLTLSLIIGSLSFAQEITKPVTQVAFNGAVWEIEEGLTHAGISDSDRFDDLLALKIYNGTDKNEYFYADKTKLKHGNKTVVLAIPFLSCGIGYDYYQLVYSAENYMLFEALNGTEQAVVLNKLQH